jgi:ubiquinone/menaquinone biosynthesis C-methylase UbiE
MAAAYDTYDYLSYWLGRDYEHKSEVFAIREFLTKIKRFKTVLEIGAGFGRLVPAYSFRAKRVIITDPSSKLLKIARESYRDKKKYKFIHSSLENLSQRLKPRSADLAVLVRVLHHLSDLDLTLSSIKRLLSERGYLILEFPNKRNLKRSLMEMVRGNFTYPLDILPTDLRSPKSLRKKTLPFLNYHPDKIKDLLEEYDFDVIEIRSVSNMRSGPLKKILSSDTLLSIEKIFQKPLSFFFFGPSIFVLARKRG